MTTATTTYPYTSQPSHDRNPMPRETPAPAYGPGCPPPFSCKLAAVGLTSRRDARGERQFAN
jgi:hypothetical protein